MSTLLDTIFLPPEECAADPSLSICQTVPVSDAWVAVLMVVGVAGLTGLLVRGFLAGLSRPRARAQVARASAPALRWYHMPALAMGIALMLGVGAVLLEVTADVVRTGVGFFS